MRTDRLKLCKNRILNHTALLNPVSEIVLPSEKSIAVFGAGIAGLTVAHELARRGNRVSVYESNSDVGGFFRSARLSRDNTPSEYSWHGFGPWYHNTFDLMMQIPYDEQGTLFEKGLSRPIEFGLATDDGESAFDDTWFVNVKNMFRMTWLDVARGSWLMFKTWVADKRTEEHYTNLNAAEAWRPYLTDRAWKVWRSSFGPWIGSDWTNVSLHTAGQFFRKQLICQPSHRHNADSDGAAWNHGARSGWLLLKGPSNECWFDRWIKYLESLGVKFYLQQSLEELFFDGNKIVGATLENGTRVETDVYVLAANPFYTAKILDRSAELRELDQLRLFRPLVEAGPHTQVSLRIAFGEKIHWPRERLALIIADSEFDLTIFAQEQVWYPDTDLGQDVQSLWTITACAASVPGRVNGNSLNRCTKAQFIDEVKSQLYECNGLNALIAQANGGRMLADFAMLRIEVWHEWEFSISGIKCNQPKWVNRVGNQQYLPSQATAVPNLLLAGAHTKTEVDVWSIEAAVESGRRAAKIVEPDVTVISQYIPVWLCFLRNIDNMLYRARLPNVIDVVFFTGLMFILALVISVVW